MSSNNGRENIRDFVARILITALVLSIAAFSTPGFRIDGVGPLLISAALISVIDFLLQSFTNIKASPFGRGIVGFITSIIILKMAGRLVAGFYISTTGAIIGSIIIGILDFIIPGSAL